MSAGEDRGTGPADSTVRRHAVEIWWGRLDEPERHLARLAATGQNIPPALFRQLADAGVLAVTEELRASIQAGAPTFPMPADIRAFIDQHTA